LRDRIFGKAEFTFHKENTMKTFLSIAALALTTLGFVSQAQAEQGKQTQVTRSNISNNRACEPGATGEECTAAEVASPRDAASGQATGKRQHKPIRMVTGEEAPVNHEVTSPRDAASGQASGRSAATGDVVGDGMAEGVKSPRDAASGQASGKRQHGSPTCVEGETCTGAEVSAPRDVASGQATGKRTAAQDHNSSRSNKTASVAVGGADADNDGVDAEGMAIKEQGIPVHKAKAGKTGSAK
jgi:hypothetical protein